MTSPPSLASSPSRPSRTTLLAIGALVLALVALGLFVGGEPAFGSPGGGRALRRIPAPPADLRSMLRTFGVGSVTWFACVLAVPPFWALAWRLAAAPRRALRVLGIQSLAVLALILVTALVQYLVAYGRAPMAPPFTAFLPVALVSSALPIVAVVAVVNALESRRRTMAGALEGERLRAELAEARLAAVTSQLQPHFLFNTLQSISTLIHRDPAAADAMLARLSDLLRDVLRRSRSALVPLDDELRMMETYLDLARLRFGDRLHVAIDVDEGARSARVPVLLLQPLVENALRHGVEPVAAGGRLGIDATTDGTHLRITVWNDGANLSPDQALAEGTGLANTRERLRHAFGADQSLELRPRLPGGVEVVMRVPLRPAGSA